MIFRKLAKDSLVYGGADMVTHVLAFFTFPLIAAALSPLAFGVLELIVTSTGLLGLLAGCGLNNAVQRFYWDKDTLPQDQPRIVTSGFFAQAFFSLISLIVGLLLLPWLLPMVEAKNLPVTWVALVAALFTMVFSQWTQYALDVIRLHFCPWRFFAVSLVSRVFSIGAGVLVVVYFGLGVDGLMTAQALMLLLVLPFSFNFIRKDFHIGSVSRLWVVELTRFGYPFIFAGLAYWVFGSMDRWMLASMSSVEEVGIYSVSFRFASLVLFVNAAFGQAWSPVAIKIYTDHPNEYRKIYGQVLVLLLYVMLIFGGGLALFSGELISVIMPNQYFDSAAPLAVLCFGVILQATQQVTAVGISLEKKTFIFIRMSWIAALVNLVLNYFFIPYYSALGAAWATSISYLFLTASYFYYTQKLHPISIQWKPLSVICILGFIVFIVSIFMQSTKVCLIIILFKIFLSVLCIIIGWRILPIKRLNYTTAESVSIPK